jgi:hypothetical protein
MSVNENVEQTELEPQVTPTEVETPEPHDGPGSGRSDIRKSLEKNFAEDRKRQEKSVRDRETGQFKGKGKRQVDEYKEATSEPDADTGIEVTPAEPTTEPPTAWAKEAKAEWAQVPAAVQQAILKREEDSTKGVDELKKRYSELDQALAPRLELIRQHGHSPAQAVNQLFQWFEALRADVDRVRQGQPAAAFHALVKSYGLDPAVVFGQPQAVPAAQPAAKEAKAAEEAPAEIQKYIADLQKEIGDLKNGITQKIGTLENTFAAQSQAKTEEMLANWAKDKPYYEDVRHLMGRLIATNAVPPLSNGNADLDKAYDMALYALPEIRTKVLAEQQAKAEAERKAKADAERKAQQEAAEKARRASGSLSLGAPGAPASQQKKPTQRKSVSDSIREAIREVSER